MKLIITNGANYWSAENACWTTARVAATEYESPGHCPFELPEDNSEDARVCEAWYEHDGTLYYPDGASGDECHIGTEWVE